MDYKNVMSPTRDNMKDYPDETNRDYEKEDPEDLKKLGRQIEV
jgi:uncharacterized membrane protein (DUF106 family)